MQRKLTSVPRRSPTEPHIRIIKRVVAVANEVVQTLPPYSLPMVRVPEGHIWVEGDEYFHSKDSNTFGPVSNPSHSLPNISHSCLHVGPDRPSRSQDQIHRLASLSNRTRATCTSTFRSKSLPISRSLKTQRDDCIRRYVQSITDYMRRISFFDASGPSKSAVWVMSERL